MTPIGPAEFADLRRAATAPLAEHQLWPNSVVLGLIEEVDRVTDAFNSQDDDLDRFIREQVAADPRFAVEYLHSGACAKLRAIRRRHTARTGPDGGSYCTHCTAISGSWVDHPCHTLRDIGVEDEFETLAATRGHGTPRARAIAAMSAAGDSRIDGIDLRRRQMDREGVIWCCIGWFQYWGTDRQDPMMSTMTGRHPDYTLNTLLRVRGPLTALDGPAATVHDPEARASANTRVFSSTLARIQEGTE